MTSPKRVAITGSTGLIGSALIERLQADGHTPLRVVRSSPPDSLESIRWDIAAGTIDAEAFRDVDAVVHLAGEGIADERWSEEQKQRIHDSRVDGTTLLATTLAELDQAPSVLISGSAIGFYGDRGDEVLTESSGPGSGFLANVCIDWEAATKPAVDAGIRVASIRTGVVLSTEGGALAEQLPFFKLGIGGRIGDGQQYLSWVSVADMVGAIVWLIDHDISGPVNLTGPTPVTNSEFTSTLGQVLNRPTFLPTPKPALWIKLGRELTEALLYSSARVEPTVLLESGYQFEHSTLEPALRALLDKPSDK